MKKGYCLILFYLAIIVLTIVWPKRPNKPVRMASEDIDSVQIKRMEEAEK